ncbi:hypothetical protein BS50DRAFT_631828 [Corynespora cassiicola Philippines]|uniref:Major facilitator superfamily (MFS) profile domain-containing protein n=1 Tax=Corynespora cassiicola Philippines TaxID=1448308 RepID=A0A2T2NXP6_CORCC|nr:hypothetical protein BS50DRAFT_631828 [Corynespora cassiicola Philippines]
MQLGPSPSLTHPAYPTFPTTNQAFEFISMFSTIAGGFEFSKRLGRRPLVRPSPLSSQNLTLKSPPSRLTQRAFVLARGRFGDFYGHQTMLLVGGAAFVVWESKFAAEPIMPLSISKALSFNSLFMVIILI